ncbi:MAG: bacterioferritin [Chloroflexi bacterium]|nr:bacterioferritin [Chloroflexota bacterium]
MKAKQGVVDFLNDILTNELTAINQYFVQAKMCENWGYERLHHKLRDLSTDEMKDAEHLVEHILYLEGVPNLQRLGTVQVGENVQEHLQLALDLERNQVSTLTQAIAHCARVEDFTTRNILEEMVRDEEGHVNWVETQLEAIKQIGLEHYLSEQLRD